MRICPCSEYFIGEFLSCHVARGGVEGVVFSKDVAVKNQSLYGVVIVAESGALDAG